VILPAEESPSVAARVAATEFPQLILLDGEGREVGRMKGKQPVEVLAKKLRRMVEAAERFRQSEATLKANPLDPEALFWVGTYRWNRGDRFLAVECFQSLLDLGRGPVAVDRENLSVALRHLAQHRLDCGRLEEAEDFFRRALSSARDDEHASSAAMGLSMCLRRQARVLEAIQVLEERFTQARVHAFLDQALFTLGYLYHEIGNREKASRYFGACREKFPDGLYGERSSRYFAPSRRSPGAVAWVPRGTSEEAEAPGATATAPAQAFTTASFSGSNLIVEELR
jgi:tetratricopeptide (TPR) repeat protein